MRPRNLSHVSSSRMLPTDDSLARYLKHKHHDLVSKRLKTLSVFSTHRCDNPRSPATPPHPLSKPWAQRYVGVEASSRETHPTAMRTAAERQPRGDNPLSTQRRHTATGKYSMGGKRKEESCKKRA
ncbi:hypothetical protein EYF80_011144 [Liparis tanakae]|uniref:Uncharacterized protein n=1 Tax=Liparis tanakae TaxID=230148 RepID=A0A4Z2IKL3_9TELE|nr:hypothetical protein EYF80_011144 [Liparis tanakae]